MSKSIVKRLLVATAAVSIIATGVMPASATDASQAPDILRRDLRRSEENLLSRDARVRGEVWSSDTVTVRGPIASLDGAVRGLGVSVLSRLDGQATVRLRDGSQATRDAFAARVAPLGFTVSAATRYRITGAPYAEPFLNFGLLWGLTENGEYPENTTGGMDVIDAWEYSTGAGAVVAVLDTGILRGHPEFLIGSGRRAVTNILPGWDFVGDTRISNDGNGWDPDPSDPGDWVTARENAAGYLAGCGESPSSWHGTHVAGTIAAMANGVGMVGVAPDARILPVRVLGKCGGYDTDIAAGIRWAAGLPVPGARPNPHPADVINLSLGGWGPYCDSVYEAAIADATAAGSLVVVSAGNDTDNAIYYSPASCAQAVTVSALGPTGMPAWYTNVGAIVDIAAPGGDSNFAPSESGLPSQFHGCPLGSSGFLSTFHGEPWPSVYCSMHDDWGTNIEFDGTIVSAVHSSMTRPDRRLGSMTWAGYEGTSMAAPHIAGLAALIVSVCPTCGPNAIQDLMNGTVRGFPRRDGDTYDADPFVTTGDLGASGGGPSDNGPFQSLFWLHYWVSNYLDYYGLDDSLYNDVATSTWGPGSPAATDLREWGAWEWYSWGDFFTDDDDCHESELDCGSGMADAQDAVFLAGII